MFLLNLLFMNLGGGEIFVILLVILLFFGSKRIPDLAKGLGKGMREFKDAMSGIENEVRNSTDVSMTPKPTDIKPPVNPPVSAVPPVNSVPVNPAVKTESKEQSDYNKQAEGNKPL